MSILITSPNSKTGGVASFVDNIYPFFSKEVKIFYRGKSANYESKIKEISNKIFAPFQFYLAIKKQAPDYIIINTSLSLNCLLRDGLFVFISKLLNRKVLLIVHGFQEKALKYKAILKLGYFKSDAIIVLADKFLKSLNKIGFDKPIYTQMNPVSLDIIDNVDVEINKLEFEDNINILFLSRIEEAKGIFTTLYAFEEILNDYPEISLKIAGKGNALDKAKKMVAERDIKNVHFLGYVKGNDKTKLLNTSDIFLFPTEHKEGLPINILEAMTAGQIIITRPVAGLKDLYEMQNFGHAIESTDPRDFANAILDILEKKDHYRAIGKGNAAFAKKHFHPQKITNNIKKILESL